MSLPGGWSDAWKWCAPSANAAPDQDAKGVYENKGPLIGTPNFGNPHTFLLADQKPTHVQSSGKQKSHE